MMGKIADVIQILSSAFTLSQYIIIILLILLSYVVTNIQSWIIEYINIRYTIENIIIQYNRLYRGKSNLLHGYGLFGNTKMWNDKILPEIRYEINASNLCPYIKRKLISSAFDFTYYKNIIMHDFMNSHPDTHSKVDNSIRKSVKKLYSIKLMIPFMKINM